MNELRECPFCENKDIKLFYWEEALVWKLECTKCYVTYTNVNKERIIKLWNSRPQEVRSETKTTNIIGGLRKELTSLQYKMESADNQTEIWHKKYDDIKEKHDILKKEASVLEKDMRTLKTSFIDIQNERDTLQNEVNKLKKDIELYIVSYTDMQNKRDALQEEVNKLKKDIQTIEFSYIDVQNKRDALQKSLYDDAKKECNALENKVTMLREDVQALTSSYAVMENKRDILQEEVNTLKKDMQTATTTYSDMQNKYNALQKSFDENTKLAKQEKEALQTKLSDERTSHQYHIDTIQSRLDIAEEALHSVMSYNVKLDANKLEEYKIAQEALKKIKGENN
jgi:chromosome segregation ATPase